LIPKKILYPLNTSLLFSGSYISAKYTTVDLGPLTASLLRYSVALIFLSFFLFHYRISSLRVKRKDLVKLLFLGLSGIVWYHYFFLLSLRYTEVANTAIINASSPILTGIMAAVFIKERLQFKNYAGVAGAFVGVIILLIRGSIHNLIGMKMNVGDAIMLLAVFSWVVYALIVKTLIRKYSGFTITFYASLFGVVLLSFLALSENVSEQVRNISSASLFGVLYMGICASGLGYFLYNLSIREIGPTKTSSFVYSLVPILVAILAFLFFRQPITLVMVSSMILIFIGLRFIIKGEKG
jgi:drug/metabolite transporter (DMT)-like permease